MMLFKIDTEISYEQKEESLEKRNSQIKGKAL
jgi:hypothetical protein